MSSPGASPADDLLAGLARRPARAPAWAPPPGVSGEALLWLALVPQTTVAIAEEAGFPAGGPAAATLDRLVELGLLVRRAADDDDDDDAPARYAMAENTRLETLRAYRGEEPGQLAARNMAIRRALADAGAGLAGSPACARELPALARWGHLARHADEPGQVAAALGRAVDRAYDETSSAELLAWIEAARPLVPLMGSMGSVEVADALGRAGRRLDLLYRRADDKRRLSAFVPRAEQIEAVNAFLAGPPEVWALHLVGHGGVGKTMLIRYIVTELARLQGLAVARVDFDYLNPDFPNLNPGLLLWSFSAELVAQAPEATDVQIKEAFAEAEHSFEEARRSLERDRLAGSPGPERPWADRAFVRGVESFCEGLRLFGRPVVLVLDTCEELARVRPDGSLVNVEATFAILRALREGAQTLMGDPPGPESLGVPNLRVIFSGRRLLASAGAGWRQEPVGPLPPRPFLEVAQLRGFSHEEARAYLAGVERGPDGLRYPPQEPQPGEPVFRVPAELVDPIISRSSPDVGGAHDLRLAGAPAVGDEPQRCNPFLVSFYADWAATENPPTADEIRATSVGRYIQERIVDRLGNRELAELLPLATLLGFVTRPLIKFVTGQDDEEAEATFRRLAEQEWMVRYAGHTEAIGVQPEMRAWLEQYYALPNVLGPNFKPLLDRATDYLSTLTDERVDPGQLDWTVVHAALRALVRRDPVGAARWWDGLVGRLLGGRGGAWLIELLGPLQAAGGAAGPPEDEGRVVSPLRPAVRAAYAAALLNAGRRGELAEVWADVEELVPHAPLGGERLLVRAATGRLVAAWAAWRAPDPALAGRLVAALRQATEPGLGVDTATLVAQHGREDFAPSFKAAIARLPPTGQDLESVATLIAGAEALVELSERELASLPPPPDDLQAEQTRLWPAELLVMLALSADRGERFFDSRLNMLVAFAYSLAARVAVLHGDLRSAEVLFDRSVARAPSERPEGSFADWRTPGEPASRLMLQAVLALHPRTMGVYKAVTRIHSLGPPRLDLDLNEYRRLNPREAGPQDRERLLSLLARLQLAWEAPEREVLYPPADAPTRHHTLDPFDLVPPEPLFWPPVAVLELGKAASLEHWPGELYRDAEAPLVFAHRRVEPAFAVGLDLLTTRWPLRGPYEALRRLATGGGPLTQEHEIRAAERRLLALDRRLRLAEVFPANEVSLAASPDPEDAWLAWAIDGLAGLEPPPAPGASAAWAHAEWRTRSARTPGARARAIAWGRERLGALLLAERPEGQMPDLLWAALILDSVELQDLADQSGEPLGGLGLAAAQYNLAARLAQAQPKSDEGLRLLLRAEALRPLVAGGRHHELIDPDWIGLRAAAAIALEEGELLMLRLPGPARSLFRRAADWYEAAGDLLGAWIAATGLTLLSLIASIPPRFLASLVGRAERLYGELLAGSGDALGDDRLPPVSVLERLVENQQGWVRDQFGPPLLRPWLLRLIACLAARADGDGPPHRATAFLNWLRAAPAPLLADWQPLVERAAADQGAPPIVRDEERPLSRRELRLALTELFSADELRLLCADIGMTYDELPGATKGERVLALLARLEQLGRRDELVARLRRLRPAVDRAGPPAAPAPPDPPPSRDQLLDALLGGFNLPELRALAWDLGLDFQALPRGLGEASEEIVARTAERRQLAELAQLILTERPTVPWGAPQPAPAPAGLGALRAALVARFDSDELAGLADALGLALPVEAASRGDQIVALIGHARRRGRLAQLAQLVAQRSPAEAAEQAQPPAALVASADELRRRAATLKPGRLVEVASDLAVDLEQLPGGEGPGLADELVRYLERRARLAELAAALADDLPRRGAEQVGEPAMLRVKPTGRLGTGASALDTHQVQLSFQLGAGALLYESPALALSAGGEIAQAQQVLPDAARRELERDVAAARLALGDYIQFLQGLPQGLREEVAVQLKLGVARGRPGPLIVEAPPALHGAPWETLLALENSSASWADLRRTVRGRQPRRPPLRDDERVSVFLPGLDSVASVTARPAWEAMVREGAGRVSGWHSSASWAPALGSVPFQLIHLFGIVRETGRGLRLVLGAERGARAEEGAQPMSVENLARTYEDLALVVLQAPPLRGGSDRSAATRREAVLLRAFAASLHEAGVPVVLVLPAVAVSAAAELARRVARAAVAPSAALPAEVRRLRTILPALVPDQPGGPEIVFDLTLFAPVDLGP